MSKALIYARTTDGVENPIVADSTDKLAVSLYGRGAAAGDTSVDVSAGGRVIVAGHAARTLGDSEPNTAAVPLNTADNDGILAVASLIFNGGTWERQRTPNVFKTVDLSASSSAQDIWEPSTGKKFRLMGFVLTPTAPTKVTLFDDSTGTPTFVTRTALDTPISPPSMGNGILSGAADNVLKILAAATSAAMQGTVWGTEE